MDLSFLLEDPLPSSGFDSHRWRRLFRLIPLHIRDRKKAYTLLTRMWTIRSAGAVLRRDLEGIRLVPLIDPDGSWPDKEFYDQEIRDKYLTPFAAELKHLIRLLEEQTD